MLYSIRYKAVIKRRPVKAKSKRQNAKPLFAVAFLLYILPWQLRVDNAIPGVYTLAKQRIVFTNRRYLKMKKLFSSSYRYRFCYFSKGLVGCGMERIGA